MIQKISKIAASHRKNFTMLEWERGAWSLSADGMEVVLLMTLSKVPTRRDSKCRVL
jgi:hypothetical protein